MKVERELSDTIMEMTREAKLLSEARRAYVVLKEYRKFFRHARPTAGNECIAGLRSAIALYPGELPE